MAIYTRFGTAIEITAARIIPVWVLRTPDEVRWSYRTPKAKRGQTIDEQPIWHYQGFYLGDRQPVCDGKWVDANSLKADGGWKEIEAKLHEMNQIDMVLFEQWNKAGAPEASHFWAPISEKEVA